MTLCENIMIRHNVKTTLLYLMSDHFYFMLVKVVMLVGCVLDLFVNLLMKFGEWLPCLT